MNYARKVDCRGPGRERRTGSKEQGGEATGDRESGDRLANFSKERATLERQLHMLSTKYAPRRDLSSGAYANGSRGRGAELCHSTLRSPPHPP